MRDSLGQQYPVVFLDDWPEPPQVTEGNDVDPGLTEVKKWRLQILLASNPWGIPSLAFHDRYRKMFGRELDVQELGFEHLCEMFHKMTDIFTIQEPGETTAILFPDYPRDIILHDARIGHKFAELNLNVGLDIDEETCDEDSTQWLINRARLERDEEFPLDVVLRDDQYDNIFPITQAKINGTMGLFQGTIVGAATPESFYIRLKGNSSERVRSLNADIVEYFAQTKYPIDAYSVPKEFIYPGFPCLTYIKKENIWERCLITGRTPNGSKILVESVDFGGLYAVSSLFLYLMPKKFFEIPRQTLRVALSGIKPSNGTQKWTNKAGSRMRCFSFEAYWLDILLMEPHIKDQKSVCTTPSSDTSSFGSLSSSPTLEPKLRGRKRTNCAGPQYEVIIVDRNNDIDIFLDEILIMETYAILDSERFCELQKTKKDLKGALKALPRPDNPFQ